MSIFCYKKDQNKYYRRKEGIEDLWDNENYLAATSVMLPKPQLVHKLSICILKIRTKPMTEQS